MEGIHLLKDLLLTNDWMVKLDLTDAYLTLSKSPEYRKYLKFYWGGKITYATSISFGISVNLLLMNQSRQELLSNLAKVLQNLGFLTNTKKDFTIRCKFSSDKSIPSKRKDYTNTNFLQGDIEKGNGFSKRNCSINRTANGYKPSCSSGPTPLL